MTRVLVTGATGFIGRQALQPLAASGFEVHAVARRPLSTPGVTWHALDLLSEDGRARAMAIRPTHLLHFAWIADHGAFWTAPENTAWEIASRALVEGLVAGGLRRVVGAGTCAEYDWTSTTLASSTSDERAPIEPATLYGRTKNAFARWLANQPISNGWGRIFFAYGPHEDRRRLVPSLATALIDGRDALVGPGTGIRDFMDSRDLGAAFATFVGSDVTGPVDVVSGRGVEIREVARLLGELSGRPDLIKIGALPARPDEPIRLAPTGNRLRNEVGFASARDLRAGLLEALEFWRLEARSAA